MKLATLNEKNEMQLNEMKGLLSVKGIQVKSLNVSEETLFLFLQNVDSEEMTLLSLCPKTKSV